MIRNSIFSFLIAVIFFLFFSGCASIVPPSGGEKDLTPPVLLSEKPEDSVTNQFVYNITLHFNKYMEVHDLEKHITISPLLPMAPTVTAYAKVVEIKLPDSSLMPNTTYRIALGDALTDNREQTPYKDYVYLFSTGDYFDSLRLQGNVIDAETGLPDSTATIFLYPAEKEDSAIVRERPDYISKVNSEGFFIFENLPDKAFQVFAVTDKDNNYTYSPEQEKIDFYDSLVTPSAQLEEMIQFAIFQAEIPDSLLEDNPQQSSSRASNRFSNRSRRTTTSQVSYRVEADTVNKNSGTFDLAKPLRIALFQTIEHLDSSKIYLSYEDREIEVEATRTLKADSSEILIKTEWQPDKIYTLRLVKGWAKDTSGAELPPGKFIFRTRSLDDYATLNINLDDSLVGKKYLLILYNDREEVWKGAALKNKITLPLLSPGSYKLKLVFDNNENGRWDTGDFFARRHAEKVLPYKGEILLKAGWVNDIDFKNSILDEATLKRDRFNSPLRETQPVQETDTSSISK